MAPQIQEVSIELSLRCLMRCRHCSSGASPVAGPSEMSTERILHLIDEAKELGATVVSLSGGDPILHPNIISFVARAAYRGLKCLIYTTGVWAVDLASGIPLGLERADSPFRDINKYQNVVWIFSMHSHKAETHDYITNYPGSWAATVGSICHAINNRANVQTHFVPTAVNWRDIPATRDLLESLHVNEMALLRFVPQTRGLANKDVFLMSHQEFRELQEMLKAELARDHQVRLRVGCPLRFTHLIDDNDEYVRHCHGGVDAVVVRPDGLLRPCAGAKTKLFKESNADVTKQGLREIWETDPVLLVYREYVSGGYAQCGGKCASCPHLEVCRGGCPAQRIHAAASAGTADGLMNTLRHGAVADPQCFFGEELDGQARCVEAVAATA